MAKTILVTGATGRQGGGLIKALLASPNAEAMKLIALTRSPQSPAAMRLKEQGVTLIKGDLDNVPAIFKSEELTNESIWGIFSVQNPGIKASATIREREQGKALIDHAIAKDVQFFVYASVDRGGTDSEKSPTPVAQFRSKHDIEQYLIGKANAMKWVILRPTTFMEGFTPDIRGTTWASAYKYIMKSTPMHLISTSDIGKVAAKVFLDPEIYANRCISLLGDKLTFEEADAIFKEKIGKPIHTMPVLPFHIVMLGLSEMKIMFKWFPANPPGLDATQCREEWGLMSWGEWIERESAFVKVVKDQ